MVQALNRPAAEMSIVYQMSNGDEIRFFLFPTLVRAAATPKDMDEFACLITHEYPGEMTISYRMGAGHRKGYYQGLKNLQDWQNTFPVKPGIRSVLYSVGMDYQTARDLPRDEADAMDYLAAEWGMENAKPGEMLRTVRALNKTVDDLRLCLKHTGIDPDHFADWCAGLE
jgi:hypothetical protein